MRGVDVDKRNWTYEQWVNYFLEYGALYPLAQSLANKKMSEVELDITIDTAELNRNLNIYKQLK